MLTRLLFVLFLLFPNASNAATYYIGQSTSGSADNSDCDNIQYTVANHNADTMSLGAGDTVYGCGTITTTIIPPVDGAVGNHIIYDGTAPGYSQAVISNSSTAYGIRITGRSYLTIKEWEVTGQTACIQIESASDNIVVQSNTVHHCNYQPGGTPTANNGIKFTDTSTNITVGGSISTGNTVYSIGNETRDANIIWFEGSGNEVSYNNIYGDASWGIDGITLLWAAGGSIHHNYIHDFTRSGAEDCLDIKEISHDIDVYENYCINSRVENGLMIQASSYNIDMYRNMVINASASGILLYTGGGGTQQGAVHDIRVWGNVVIGADGNGIVINSGAYPSYNLYINNNTLANNGDDGSGECSFNAYDCTNMRIGMHSGSSNIVVKNNILRNGHPATSGTVQIYRTDSAADSIVDLDGNLYDWSGGTGNSVVRWQGANRTLSVMQSTYSKEASGVEGAALLTDPGSNNVTISSATSAAVGAALTAVAEAAPYTAVLCPSSDFTTLPTSNDIVVCNQTIYGEPEIGAYVFGSILMDLTFTPSFAQSSGSTATLTVSGSNSYTSFSGATGTVTCSGDTDSYTVTSWASATANSITVTDENTDYEVAVTSTKTGANGSITCGLDMDDPEHNVGTTNQILQLRATPELPDETDIGVAGAGALDIEFLQSGDSNAAFNVEFQ